MTINDHDKQVEAASLALVNALIERARFLTPGYEPTADQREGLLAVLLHSLSPARGMFQ